MSCFNMLFAIQMSHLPTYGSCLTKLTLTESEFVHPQTLNPFALHCPNLDTLILVNPVIVSDDLFVGRLVFFTFISVLPLPCIYEYIQEDFR